jgi:tetratricopeptide (TPR) repeat protein
MLFELRNAVPEVSASWCETRDLFLAGRTRRAWGQAVARRGAPSLETANDYVLNLEIARACGANRTYLALARLARQAFPDDVYVRLYHARALLTRGLHTLGLEFLHQCEDSLGKTDRVLWATQLANMYADVGFEVSCRRWLDAVAEEPGIDSPLALYTRSCAFEGLRQWEDAAAVARRCLAAAPKWARARTLLVHCLLTQGRIDEARSEIAAGELLGHEDAYLDITAAMLAFSRGQFAEAQEMFESILAHWPQANFIDWVRRTLCVLLVEVGRCDAAHDLAQGKYERDGKLLAAAKSKGEKELGLPEITPAAAGRPHRFHPLPLVAQNRNQCVPTAVAMSVWPQGKQLEPNQLYREMRGREGTALWRMRRWVEANGLRLIPIRLERQAIIEMLDQGIPLIGVIEGPFNSHVDVVCGYHEGLEVFYVRDPVHWAPLAYPYEMALNRYELHGALLAIIDARSTEIIARARQLKSGECDALLDLAQAVAEGDRLSADRAYAQIPDDSHVAFLRDGMGCGVALSPRRLHENMQKLAENEEANGVARFRALLGLESQDALQVLKQLLEKESDKLGQAALRYLRLLRCMHDGKWNEALGLIDRLLVRGAGVPQFWDMKGDIRAELGDQPGSEEALGRAIELEPRRMSFREKSLNRTASRLTFAEYLQEFESLLEDDPDDKTLLWGRAGALMDGPDGKAYAAAARDCIHWFPRDPRGYGELIQWYQMQGRGDLADTVLTEGRELLPEIFAREEETEDAADSSDQSDRSNRSDLTAVPEADTNESTDPKQANPELPEAKEELLNLIWTPEDPRRPAALERLAQLEQDGQLPWFERASVLANRLLAGADNNSPTESEVNDLLPLPTPGAAHWFTNVVADYLTDHDPAIRVALAVNHWIDRAVPDYRSYVGLWFNRVLLLEKARRMEQAFDELKALVDRYPAYSAALYRMGVVEYRQDDYRSAQKFFEQALDINPGQLGSMHMLRNVFEVLDDDQGVLRCLRMLRRKVPYDFDVLRDELLFVAEHETVGAAEEILHRDRDDYCPRRLGVLGARLKLQEDRVDEADRLLTGLSVGQDDEEQLYEDYLQTRLSIALAKEEEQAILGICDEGLRRWPDSTRLKEIQAEHLAGTRPDRSRTLLRDVLWTGEPQPQTAYQYLQLTGKAGDVAAREVVTGAAEDRREALAELFSEVLAHHSMLHWNAKYLEWALGEFPESDELRYRLAMHYNMNGQTQKAVNLAEELRRRNPDNPEALRMLGRCLIDQDPHQALPHLEKVCQQNRSADYLFDLGRCYQLTGDVDRSKQVHWEILEQNPYLSASWTNLFLFGDSPSRLWPFVAPMLQRGCGVEDEYFLVAAVELAVNMRKQLVVEWFPLAMQRLQVLRTHPGFRDELPRLRKSILAWLSVRPQDGQSVPAKPKGMLDSLSARFFWPRRAWVPRA